MPAPVIFIALLLSFSAVADEGLYLTAGIGLGGAEVKPAFQADNRHERSDTFDLGIMLGYRFSNNLQIEAGHISHGTLDVFGMADRSSMSENVITIGYAFELAPASRIIPRVGHSAWRFESTEGTFLNPGNEAQSSATGNETIFSVTLTYSDFFLTYQSNHYDFGQFSTWLVGFEF